MIDGYEATTPPTSDAFVFCSLHHIHHTLSTLYALPHKLSKRWKNHRIHAKHCSSLDAYIEITQLARQENSGPKCHVHSHLNVYSMLCVLDTQHRGLHPMFQTLPTYFDLGTVIYTNALSTQSRSPTKLNTVHLTASPPKTPPPSHRWVASFRVVGRSQIYRHTLALGAQPVSAQCLCTCHN